MATNVELSNKISVIDEKLDTLASDVAVIIHTLNGNGTEGICQKVERHERILNKGIGVLTVVVFALGGSTATTIIKILGL